MLQKRLCPCRIFAAVRPRAFDRQRMRALRQFLEQCHRYGIHTRADIEALRGQFFCFLNHQVAYTGAIPWLDSSLPRLWRYHLHGFGYARDFSVNAVKDDYLGDRDRAVHWMRDWAAENPVGADVAWDAYPVSERLINWALSVAAFDIYEDDIARSYAQQTIWLWRRLEYDLRANHLLKNAVALVVAAAATADAPQAKRALTLLETQVSEQVLDDGGHYERSPMYHACVLWDLLVVMAVLEETPVWLTAAVKRMTLFLERICHPDGDIPLFGDAALYLAPPTQALITIGRELTQETASADRESYAQESGDELAASGFFMPGGSKQTCRLVVKTAPPAPAWQPGHSHADMLSYELCIGDSRIIVDSGVHGYGESMWRDYCRGGSAHNIAQMEGLEQCELWGVFRIARRSEAVTPIFEKYADGAQLVCGYLHYTGYRHMRRIRYYSAGISWEFQDTFELDEPRVPLRNYIHLHPDCKVRKENNKIDVARDRATLRIEALNGETIEIYEAGDPRSPFRYCPEFGVATAAPVIVMNLPPPATNTAYRIDVVS